MFFILIFFIPAIICSKSLLPPTPKETPCQILNQFPDYGLVVHFDSATVKNLDDILATKRHNTQPTLLLNYDQKHSETRPKGYKYINVVYLTDPYTFETYSEIDYNFGSQDVVLFLVDGRRKRVEESRIWKMRGLSGAANILILNRGELYHCCYYCGNATAVLRKIHVENARKHTNDYSNFNGHVFKIAYTNYPPFFWCDSAICEPRGAEGALLREFSRVHNFRYDLIELRSDSDKGAWKSMVEAVEFKKVDWAVGGLSVSIRRGIYTDMTRYIKTQGFAVLYATYEQTWTIFESFLLVYEWTVWLGVCLAVIGVCVVAKLAGNSPVLGYMKVALMSLVEQTSTAHSKFLKSDSIRIVFVIWWLSCMCLTSVYKSRLASTSIKPIYKEPKNIDDLVARGFTFHVHKDVWDVLLENLATSSDRVYEEVLKNIRSDLEFCQSVVAAGDLKMAVIDEETPIQNDIFTKCVIPGQIRARLRLVAENLFPNTYHAWSMKMASPFRLKFSETMGRLDDHGLIDYWYKSVSIFRMPRSNAEAQGGAATPLTLAQILPPLAFLTAGSIVACCVFLTELYVNKRRVKMQLAALR